MHQSWGSIYHMLGQFETFYLEKYILHDDS